MPRQSTQQDEEQGHPFLLDVISMAKELKNIYVDLQFKKNGNNKINNKQMMNFAEETA